MMKLNLRKIIAIFAYCTSIAVAGLVYDTPFSSNTHVPQGTKKYDVLNFSLQGSSVDESLTSITIRNTSNTVKFNNGISAVYLYLDADKSGSLDTSTDTLLSTKKFSANTSSAILTLTNDSGELITTENSKYFIIAYDIDQDAKLESYANVTLDTINTAASNLDMDTITNSDTPTFNNVAITGIKQIVVDTTVIPDIALPGQDGVAMLYFSVELSGTEEDNGETIDNNDILITIENSESNFVTDSSTNGITTLYLYRENIPVYNSADRIFNPDTVTLVKKITKFSDASTATINITSSQTSFTEIGFGSSNTENYWIVYDIGADISVTADTIVAAQLTSFSGLGSKSDEYLSWPLDSSDIVDGSEVSIAGLTLVEIDSIVPANSVFGASTKAPILSFKLRSNHTASTLNSITILNPGTVGFITDEDEANGITVIEIYEDTDRNETLDENQDTRVAYKVLPENNTASQAYITLSVEGTDSTQEGVLLEAFDSAADDTQGYFGNNDAVFFVLYQFGEDAGGSNNDSGLTSIARLGNCAASVNVLLNDFGDQEEIAIYLSDVDNSTPATADPEAEITISSEINLSVSNVKEIAPPSVIEGQIKVPMLAITLESDSSFPSASFTILNPKNSFLPDNRGVTQVWVYEEDADLVNQQLDSTDIFKSATTTFVSTSKAVLSGISIDVGTNYFLVLYDFGMNSKEKSDKIQAQLSTIQGSADNDNTLVLAGNLPYPTVPNAISVNDPKIDTLSLSVSEIDLDNATSYNVTISVSNDTSSSVVLESMSPKVYLDDISGNDITYQFDVEITSDDEFPYTLTAGETLDVIYLLGHKIQLSDGSAVVDAYLRYQATTTMDAKRERYYSTNDTWIPAVTEEQTISLTSLDTLEYYEFPSYIEDVNIIRSSTTIAFEQYNAIKSGDKFSVTFKDSGSFVSESSIQINLNGTALTSSQYSYDADQGILQIKETGTTDGTLTIDVDDTVGNPLDTTTIYFSLTTELKVLNALFYPNPYVMGASDLELGFNLTKEDVTIKYYLYDQNGVRVHSGTETFSDIGYNTITFDQSDDYLAPGIYVLKMIAETDDGQQVTSSARLAIY